MKVAMPRLRAVAAAALGAATALPWASSFHAALGVGAPAAGSALAHRGRAAMGPAVRGPHMALSRTANASRAWTSAARRDMARADVSKLAELAATCEHPAYRDPHVGPHVYMPAGLDLTPP